MLGALVVLLFFHLVIFSRLAFRKPRAEPDRSLPISVVICARNEARQLEELIPLLMEQDHQEFEVVVVNDRSEDDTGEILQWMKPKYERLRIVAIQADEKFSYGKKIALGVGIRAAKHPQVLLTDADCRPAGRDWISCMASGFGNGKQIVIGHSPYASNGGLTSLLERFDGLTKAMQYVSFALAGFPYMGVGRNLGYTSDLFYRAGDRKRRHHHLMSGDDDLFINEVARARNTTAVIDPRSHMSTRATSDLYTWFVRKRRHYTTARHYRFGHQLLLMLLPLARIVFWITLIWLALLGAWREVAIGAGLELLVFQPINLLALGKLRAGAIKWLALPLEWLFLLLDPIIYISTILSKPRRWK
jgi:glycosyltransferase involved in cell wall biosynthesis